MQRLATIATALFVASLVAACAASPTQFAARGREMGDTRVCRTWVSASEGTDKDFMDATAAEVTRRGLDYERCRELINQQRAAIGAALLVTAVVVAAASSDGSGGAPAAAYDSEYAWDQFQNEFGQLTTRCRGVQTGRFADNSRCAGKYVNDVRWPGPHFY